MGATVLLAVFGLAGISSSVAQASPPPAPAWTKQAPAAHPPARSAAAMAYDPATGTAVLFGGQGSFGAPLGDTWTWNGTTWTQRHPATSPPARWDAMMAYDAATNQVVLFGGIATGNGDFRDTWTWNGSTWTQQHPATSPAADWTGAMTYDAATGTVVLFGGTSGTSTETFQGVTWTWNGTNWVKKKPATSPPARYGETLTYDAATGTVVLFGGYGPTAAAGDTAFSDTWTWNGTTWAQRHPATHPAARYSASAAYDAAAGNVVLFGGYGAKADTPPLADTWTWNGITWAKQATAAHPAGREGATMAYDAAAGNVMLFAGSGAKGYTEPLSDTWIWG